MTLKGLFAKYRRNVHFSSENLPSFLASVIIIISCLYQTLFIEDARAIIFTVSSISGLLLIRSAKRVGFISALVLQGSTWVWMALQNYETSLMLLFLELTVTLAYCILGLAEDVFKPMPLAFACEVSQNKVDIVQQEKEKYEQHEHQLSILTRKLELLEEEKAKLTDHSTQLEKALSDLLHQSRQSNEQVPEQNSALNSHPTHEEVSAISNELKCIQSQKDRLWQQLFDARQEITILYQQKQEMELQLNELSQREELFKNTLHERDEYKNSLEQNKGEFERDKKALEDHIEWLKKENHEFHDLYSQEKENSEKLKHKLAEVNEKYSHLAKSTSSALADTQHLNTHPNLQDAVKLSQHDCFEAMYRQLKEQFELKSKTLDDSRKEVFLAQEKAEVADRALQEFVDESEVRRFEEVFKVLQQSVHEQNTLISFYESELESLENLVQILSKKLEIFKEVHI